MINAVHRLEQALAALERCDPTSPGYGVLRKRAESARNALPQGALDVLAAAELEPRWRRLLGDALDRPEATVPQALVGATYWLSSHDGIGAVLRVAIEARGPQPPWTARDFWPGAAADSSATRAADAAHDLCQRLLGSNLDPLFGFHRVRCLDHDTGLVSDLRIEGESLGAALALMLVSLRARVPIPVDVAVTGNVDAEGRLVLPRADHAAIRCKVNAVFRERRCVRTVYVPKGLEIEHPAVRVVGLERFDDLLRAASVPVPSTPEVFTLKEWSNAVLHADELATSRSADTPVLRARLEQLERAFDGFSVAERARSAIVIARVQLLRRLCEYRAHTMDLDGLRVVNAQLDAVLAEHRDGVPWSCVAAARNAQASARIDLREIAAARRSAKEALEAAVAARDVLEEARILSTMGRVEAHARREESALAFFDRALERFEQVLPWESNIARCYRVGVLARLGRFEEARGAIAEADRASNEPTVSLGWRVSNDMFLAYEALKISMLEGDLARASHEARAAHELSRVAKPWPFVGVLRRIVDRALRAGDRGEAMRTLEELCTLADSESGAAATLFAGDASALVLAHDLAEERVPDSAILRRAREWLARLPPGDDENPFRAATERALACFEAPGPELATSLRALSAIEIY